MSHAQPFTPEEIERLNQLEQLINQPYARMDALRKRLAAGFHPRLWAELLGRVEYHEAGRLKAIDTNIDLKRALVRGEAWKTREGKLDCTWPGAGDGKIAPKQTLPMLWITDLAAGRLKPHGNLHSAAAILLQVTHSEEPETERQRFENRLKAWERLAAPFMVKGKADRMVKSFLSRPSTQPIEIQAVAYQKFIQKLVQSGDAAPSPEPSPSTQAVAENLWSICQDLRMDSKADSLDSETHFLRMNQLTEAVRLADQLKLLASKGNTQRNLEMLAKKGRKAEPFVAAVCQACEQCLRKTPGRRPLPKDVLEAMRARIVLLNNQNKVTPRKSVKVDWKPAPVTTFLSEIGKWAKSKGLKISGSMRPKKGEELPKPEPF